MDAQTRGWRWSFGDVVLDEAALELSVAGEVVALEPKPLELLRVLVRRPGEVVTKDELLDAVWPGRVVTEGVLGKAVAKLRTALADEDGQLVRTAHGYGYRLVAEVRAEALERSAEPSPLALEPGQAVAGRRHWLLQRRLGEGGHGEVWLVEHDKTRERRVFKFARNSGSLGALKREVTLFRLFLDALGERPDLAPVLDWNFDEAPYFIESPFAPQGSLLDYADSLGGIARLPLSTRLELAAQIADALAAAHSVGVLHKDLKPGNVLIHAEQDPSAPRAQLTDFGSARLLDPGQLEALGITRLGYTRTRDRADEDSTSGTPLYLAPELLAGHAPTLRSDVYALGVLLWQLVIGDLRRPLAPGWEREVEDPLLREDIADCIDGEPARRLDSAAALAQRLRSLDLRRALQAELERRESLASELSARLARARGRRRWLLALSAVLGLGLAVSTLMYVRLQQSQALAVAAAARAESEAAHARAVNQFLVEDLLAAANPLDQGEGDPDMREVLTRAARAVDGRFPDRPDTEAAVRLMLARSFTELSAFEPARAQLDAAERLLAALPAAELKLRLLNARAGLLESEGRFAEALALLQQGPPPMQWEDVGSDDGLADAALAYRLQLALMQLRTGDAAAALQGFDTYVPKLRERRGAVDSSVLTAESNRGEAQLVLGEVEAAYATLRANADLARQHYGEDDLRSAVFARAPAGVAYRLGRLDEAEAGLDYAQRVLTAELGAGHPHSLTARGDFAVLLRERGRLEDAEAAQRAMLAEATAALGEAHPMVALATGNLAHILESAGRLEEAIEIGERALALKIAAHGRDSEQFTSQTHNLARYEQKLGRWAAAEARQREMLPVAEAVLDADHWQLGLYRCAWAESLARLGRGHEALPLLAQGLPPMIAVFGADSPNLSAFVELQQSLQTTAKSSDRQHQRSP